MDKFWADQAAERMDSVGPEMEEFFEVNAEDDGDGEVNNVAGSIDFYKRRDSKTTPNSRKQSMNDKMKEEYYLDKKIKPELQEIIKQIELEEKHKNSDSEIGECL